MYSKNIKFLVICIHLAVLGLSSSGWSSELCKNGDPLSPAAEMLNGPYAGRCLLNAAKRPAQRLTNLDVQRLFSQQNLSVEASRGTGFWVANAFSLGEFYLVKIPPEAPSKVVVQIEHFSTGVPNVPAAHVQFRISYASNLKFFRQFPLSAQPSFESHDLVFSVEANSAEGQPWDILRTLIPDARVGRITTETEYVLVYRARSLADAFKTMISDQGNRVEQWELAITAEEKRDLVNVWLENSELSGSHTPYHLLGRSCSTELFKNLDQMLKKSRASFRIDMLTRSLNHFPWRAQEALNRRGLLLEEGQSELPTLNTEMAR